MLAIMPPPDLAKDIERVRLEFSEKYHCKAALKPPVHITLVPPYKAAEETEAILIDELETWGRLQIPFPVTLENFGSFRNNGVVYINVSSNDLLQLFHADFVRKFKGLLPQVEVSYHRPYHPHITIGYRDIPTHVFTEAAREYHSRNFFATFVTDRFYLWKHNTRQWEVLYSFAMGNRSLS